MLFGKHITLTSRLLLPVFLITLGVLVALSAILLYTREQTMRSAGIRTAQALTQQILALRSYYTTEVVGRAQASGMHIGYDFASQPNTLPLPATLVKALGDSIAKDYPGMEIRLYSHYPFPHRVAGERYDAFELSALAALEREPRTAQFAIQESGGQEFIRYAVADQMKAGCIACHNSHPESPKRDWRVGDVRGVVAVKVPLRQLAKEINLGIGSVGLATLAGFCLVGGVTALVTRKLTRGVGELVDTMETIAHTGNLGAPIPSHHQDELGQLSQAFGELVGRQRGLVQEIHDGIAVLTETSADMLASASQVATGAQETAAAIGEIASTVEEVKQTAVLAGSKSMAVSESTERTRQIAGEGQVAVEDALRGMTQVRELMQAVAENIMRLGEQSQAIGEIVASVNDLAEQSNLLGVNASIEAVKAGEAGKGFSVVAQEVKALAEQSKLATGQVRAILYDIQKAMTKAVLVAEQGSKAVESGYERAQVSGHAIRTLTGSIEASSEVALQIAATSQQQMVGMDQVATAMSNIRKASQDNVAGSRQVNQAARNLHELGLKLKSLAGQFKL